MEVTIKSKQPVPNTRDRKSDIPYSDNDPLKYYLKWLKQNLKLD